jgi:hypothetical protein
MQAKISQQRKWLLLLGLLLTLAGYWGPWVNHRAAGLVITGLDLAEYVKFLPTVRGGQITLWRESFYLPLVVVSLTSSLYAFRREFGYSWPLRTLLLALAVIAALNLLPPAWTPPLLRTPEFRQQTLALVGCLVLMGLSPFWALLPARFCAFTLAGVALWAIILPIRNFLRVLPTITELYQEPLRPGWGVYLLVAGLGLVVVAVLVEGQ